MTGFVAMFASRKVSYLFILYAIFSFFLCVLFVVYLVLRTITKY